jgi:hypothetical protein
MEPNRPALAALATKSARLCQRIRVRAGKERGRQGDKEIADPTLGGSRLIGGMLAATSGRRRYSQTSGSPATSRRWGRSDGRGDPGAPPWCGPSCPTPVPPCGNEGTRATRQGTVLVINEERVVERVTGLQNMLDTRAFQKALKKALTMLGEGDT